MSIRCMYGNHTFDQECINIQETFGRTKCYKHCPYKIKDKGTEIGYAIGWSMIVIAIILSIICIAGAMSS